MFLFVLFIATTLLTSAPARADNFRNFRIPSHKVHQWLASANATARQAHNGWERSQTFKNESFNLSGNGSTTWLWESERQQTFLRGGAGLSAAHEIYGSEQVSNEFNSYDRSNSQRRKSLGQAITFSGSRYCYPWSSPIGIFAQTDARAEWSQFTQRSHDYSDWHNSSGESNTSLRSETWVYDYQAYGDIGTVWGRVRNATGIFTAAIVEDRLRETGSLSGELRNETIQKLAELFYRIGDYKLSHMRPDKYYWSDFWDILKTDPAVHADAENAFNAYRLSESLTSGGIYRGAGWKVGPLLRLSHQHNIYRFSSEQRDIVRPDSEAVADTSFSGGHKYNDWNDELLLGASGEWHFPMGLRWQFDLQSTVLFSLNDTVDGLQTASYANVTYVIADRWLATIYGIHDRTIDQQYITRSSDPHRLVSDWSTEASAIVSYLLEDRWRVNLAINNYQTKSSEDQGGDFFSRNYGASIGFSFGPGSSSIGRPRNMFYN